MCDGRRNQTSFSSRLLQLTARPRVQSSSPAPSGRVPGVGLRVPCSRIVLTLVETDELFAANWASRGTAQTSGGLDFKLIGS